MQITVNIPDELAAQALAQGSTPERYVEHLLAAQGFASPVKRPTTEQFREALDALAQFSEKIPDLPIEAFSRAASIRIMID